MDGRGRALHPLPPIRPLHPIPGGQMRSRIFPIIRKEFIQIRRDPRTLVIMLVVPAIQMFLFGYAVTTNVDHIPTVVYDQSLSSRSRSFVQAFTNTEYFTLVGQ